jgi:hypothetical protein
MYVGDQEIYLKVYNGKFVKIIWIAVTSKQANNILCTDTNCSLILETKRYKFIALTEDLGI